MENELPQPIHQPAAPASGWWKAPASLGTDPVFLRITDESRMAAVGVYASTVGWCVSHEALEGWIPRAAILYGQVCAAPPSQIEAVVDELVRAGIFALAEHGGMEGYVVAGASKAVTERFARQQSAANAGKASAEASASKSISVSTRRTKIDPNAPVDWSKETGEL